MATKKVLRLLAIGAIVTLLATALSGCDQIMSLLGLGDEELNENQKKLELLFSELMLADNEVMQYAQANGGAMKPGFDATESATAMTREYTDYVNAHGVEIDGTDILSFDGPPGPESNRTGGNMNMAFSGSIEGGPYTLILKMTVSSNVPEYTECSINGTDMLDDYLDMQPDEPPFGGPPGGPTP